MTPETTLAGMCTCVAVRYAVKDEFRTFAAIFGWTLRKAHVA